MSGNASEFVGGIPGNYDRFLGPVIFEGYAADLARRAAALKPLRVVELAAGTGIVSRKLRDELPAVAQLFVTDLNAPMLAVAHAKFTSGERIEFATADAMKLDFPDGSFDLIVCQFGVMFFPDKVASFREALRVLRPGGTYLFNTWGQIAENPFAAVAHEVSASFFPDNPPGFYRVPFSYADPGAAEADLKAAGFASVTHEVIAFGKQVADFGALARGLVHGNPLVDEIVKRGGDPDDVMRATERRLRETLGAEPVALPLKATVFTARRP